MAKKESQDGKSKKGLPRLMELAIYFIIQEIVGAYPDFSTLDVPKVLGYGGLALGGVLLNINVNIKMYIFDHLRMYIFAILPLDRYIFSIDRIFP